MGTRSNVFNLMKAKLNFKNTFNLKYCYSHTNYLVCLFQVKNTRIKLFSTLFKTCLTYANKIYNFLSNFLEDDLPDHLRLDKFRTTPDDGQIERIPSSLEVLQAKLNTIS